MNEAKRSLARIESADIGEVYNGILGLAVMFAYEDGGCQGLGSYMLEASFIARFMGALGIMNLSKAIGRSCWVTHTHSRISRIEPLHAKDGRPFDIDEWQAWVRRRLPAMSWTELSTGENPEDRNRS